MRAADYPNEYAEIFTRALKAPVRLRFTTKEKAVSFRVELYKYRYAVRDELPQTKTQYHKLMKITMSIKDRTLIIQTKKSKFVEKLNDN